LTNFLEYIFS